jgi:hypothetical protein
MEFTRMHATLDSYTFNRFYNSDAEKHWIHMQQLMKDAGIQFGLPAYDACIHGKLIVDHWNEKYASAGQQFKMFVFEEIGPFLPAFKYGADQWNVPIPIAHVGNHFNGVRRAGSIFRTGYKYCYECLTIYQSDQSHRKDCKARLVSGRHSKEKKQYGITINLNKISPINHFINQPFIFFLDASTVHGSALDAHALPNLVSPRKPASNAIGRLSLPIAMPII